MYKNALNKHAVFENVEVYMCVCACYDVWRILTKTTDMQNYGLHFWISQQKKKIQKKK